jgi:hypothetical protein
MLTAYIKAISARYGMVKGVDHQATSAEGDDVAVFYVLDTSVAKAPVAEWYRSPGRRQLKAQALPLRVRE